MFEKSKICLRKNNIGINDEPFEAKKITAIFPNKNHTQYEIYELQGYIMSECYPASQTHKWRFRVIEYQDMSIFNPRDIDEYMENQRKENILRDLSKEDAGSVIDFITKNCALPTNNNLDENFDTIPVYFVINKNELQELYNHYSSVAEKLKYYSNPVRVKWR